MSAGQSELAPTRDLARWSSALAAGHVSDSATTWAKHALLDWFGVTIAGSREDLAPLLLEEFGGKDGPVTLVALGARAKAHDAALINGTLSHALDYDDVNADMGGHPTAPVAAAALALGESLGKSGRDVLLAFIAGYEVECQIGAMAGQSHYEKGFHATGTFGTFGATAASARLMGLDAQQTAVALGIAASEAAGLKYNFGTMTKPLHVGRAAENGVTAALLAARGFTADPTVLDGQWGFFSVMGEGLTPEKTAQGFGKEYTIVNPGVSIKPYPSGILTHQSMDAMLALVLKHDLRPEQVEHVGFHAGRNITEPIRYPVAVNHLQAKFSMPALLSMIVLCRRASHHEFSDAFVAGPAMQDLQKRTSVHVDPEIDARGYDRIRSRIEVLTKDGRTLVEWADERYRGGPSNPISDADLEGKFRMCAEGALDTARQDELVAAIGKIDRLERGARLAELMTFTARSS